MFVRSIHRPRRIAALALLGALAALQFVAAPAGDFGATRSETHLATSAPLPCAPAAPETAGLERPDGDVGTSMPDRRQRAASRVRGSAAGAVADGFCPWRAAHALARAGRAASPSTAPPLSPV